MPSWSDILDRVQSVSNEGNELNKIRSEYLHKINEITSRNVISYYSCWLKNPGAPNSSINDQDQNAFMNAVHQLDRDKGLDLILHTPGGDLAATENIVKYLHKMFNGDIRAIIPQISMSAGTIIAMSCREIIMGKQSCLGPIDPQMGGVACQAVIEEFKQAVSDIASNPSSAPLWQVIVSKYNPTFLINCQNAIKWSEQMMEEFLTKVNPGINLATVKETFLNNNNSFSHSRHITIDKCISAGLNIANLEDDQRLQDAVLSLHHAYIILFDKFNVSKVVENHNGASFIQQFNPQNRK